MSLCQFKTEVGLECLYQDYYRARDPLEKIIIQNMIRLKEQQSLQDAMSESLQSLDSEDDYDPILRKDHKQKHIARKSAKPKDADDVENLEKLDKLDQVIDSSLKQICKKQEDDLRAQAYREIIEGSGKNREDGYEADDDDYNDRKSHKESIMRQRGRMERAFRNKDLDDPKYAQYIQGDKLNNKMMERLNSEIDFRMQGVDRRTVIKPFEENNNDYEDGYGYEDDYQDNYPEDYQEDYQEDYPDYDNGYGGDAEDNNSIGRMPRNKSNRSDRSKLRVRGRSNNKKHSRRY